MTIENGMADPCELETRVSEARRRGDIRILLEVASEAMDALEASAPAVPDALNRPLTEDEMKALNAARRIGYNAAADVWPGWEIGVSPRSDTDLQAAQTLARRSSALVDRLDLGAVARGNAIWLIGAFDLARGLRNEAFEAFREAAGFYAVAPAVKLLSEGYMAIAAESPGHTAAPPEFTSVIAKLDELASEDAKEFQAQLQVARQVFNHR